MAWLQKPVSGESLEAVWKTILGAIPEAPGLEDLDELYPDRIQVEADEGPLLPLPGTLPLPLPDASILPDLPVVLPVESGTGKPKKVKLKKKRLVFVVLLALIAGGLGYAYQQGMLPV